MHAEKLTRTVCHAVDHCDILLGSVVIALDGVIVHSHDQKTTLLSHFQNVCVVDRVSEEGPVSQTMYEQLVVE